MNVSLNDSSFQSYKIASKVALFLAAIFSIGFFQSDEHFQILEFAGMKMGTIEASQLPWEYEHKMRSAFQPLLVVWIHRLLSIFGIENPFLITTLLRLSSAFLTYYSMVAIYRVYIGNYSDPRERRWFAYLSFLLWGAIFVGVRYASESWSGSLITLGFSMYFLRPGKWFDFLGMGFLFGLAYLCRYQASLMVFGFVAWLLLIEQQKISRLLILMAGILIVMGLGVVIDYWFYGEWTWTFWHYIDQNIIHDKVSNFGVDPWWYYLLQIILALVPPFSLIPLFCFVFLLLRRTKHELVWLFVPFLFIHFMIGHKELRFLFPLIGFLPALVMEGIRHYYEDGISAFYAKKSSLRLGGSFAVVNVALLLFVCLIPLDRTTPLYRFVYNEYQEATTLYYIETDPYKEGHLTYYKRPNLRIVQIKQIEDIPEHSGRRQIFATERPRSISFEKHRLSERYKTLPRWVFYLNFNGWIERTHVWYLYEKK